MFNTLLTVANGVKIIAVFMLLYEVELVPILNVGAIIKPLTLVNKTWTKVKTNPFGNVTISVFPVDVASTSAPYV